jgi:YebC/PmpR family DNA-binding regulatory protein
MSGHSHWATIKRKKEKEDSKRGKAFTKMIKEITVAAKTGGGDPAGNPRLRLLIEKARDINMPIDNITRAIKRGTGEIAGVNYEAMTYEGYGPNGMAIIIDTLTDNKNRIVGELRHIFSGKGGNLAESGAVNWMFEKMGVLELTAALSEDDLLEKLIEFDLKDIKHDENFFSIYCDPKSLEAIKHALQSMNIKVEKSEVEWVAKTPISLPDEQAKKAYDLLDALEELDDVQNVYANLE